MSLAKSTNSLFLDLYDLQKSGVMVDTRIILDDGENKFVDVALSCLTTRTHHGLYPCLQVPCKEVERRHFEN